MQQLIIFLGHHWLLTLMLVILLVAIIVFEIKMSAGVTHGLAAADMVNAINRQQPTIIDIRSAKDYLKGHIANAINIEFNSLQQSLKRIQKHKNKLVIVYCADATQSAKFSKQLLQQGFSEVKYLLGGLAAWQKENLPLKKKK